MENRGSRTNRDPLSSILHPLAFTYMEQKRYFTLSEANQTLKLIRDWVAHLTGVKKSIDEKASEVELLKEKGADNAGSPLGTLYVEELIDLQNTLNRIQEQGILVKDLNRGLIDFPHLREGREVYLCWELGEDSIEYWHEVEDGYAGRQKI
ncbi:MAG TPA: DUF2203 domain-containing protein [Acidobacteriota bacterium]|nr:DUF2203 domain-containing protein [Acidobacteriota bacterium]